MGKTKVRRGDEPSAQSVEEKLNKAVPNIELPLVEHMLRVSCSSTISDLESLLTSFLSQLEPHINDMDKKTRECAEKEKQLIKQRLIFFNSIHRDIAEPKRCLNYLTKMTDLLAHYVGVEILASSDPSVGKNKSRNGPDDKEKREEKNLMSRIITTLYTSLDSSEDHILDTMMKLRAPLEKIVPNKDVYSKLFRIIVNKAQKRQVNDLTYMRYVLVVRLWMRMMNAQRKEKVIKMVSKRLWPPPRFVEQQWAVLRILPKPPTNTLNITEFFLREKINVRKTIKQFLTVPCEAAHQSTMFLNLSCDPRLLNPKVRQSRSVPLVDAPIQEFVTLESTADYVWQRLHGPPLSQSSVFDQVTNLKRAKICSTNRVFNLLHAHHAQLKARKAEGKKLSKACGQGRPVMGSHRPPGIPEGLGIFPPKALNRVSRESASPRTRKSRLLESVDTLLHKKSKSDNHTRVHPSYVAGSLRKDNAQLAMVSPFTENPSPLKDASEVIMDPKKVKLEVKDVPSSCLSGSSCRSEQGDRQCPPKLAIENAVEETLQELQKNKPNPVRMASADDVDNTVPLDSANSVQPATEISPDCFGSGYLGQQDLSSGDDIWLDDWLASYPSSACPEGQDFWAMIATEDHVDYS